MKLNTKQIDYLLDTFYNDPEDYPGERLERFFGTPDREVITDKLLQNI